MNTDAKHSSLDIISNLPSNIIDTILCLVSIKDAVRTSILSKKWRYNWTKIPKLVFNENDMFDDLFDKHPLNRLEVLFRDMELYTERKELTKRCKVFYAIHQILLLHHGPILDFTLVMDGDNACIEIDQIITYLSRNNTVKKFKLDLTCNNLYKLPSSFFLLHQLTNIYLINCGFELQPTFKGFGCLTTLFLKDVHTSVTKLVLLVSKSPLLKSFTLVFAADYNIHYDGSFYEVFKYIPLIEHLFLDMWFIQETSNERVPQELPGVLVHLKYLRFNYISFSEEFGLAFLGLLIRNSPNLEKLKLQVYLFDNLDNVTIQDYSDIWLEHLHELEIEEFADVKPWLEFVKLILVKSPVLKKVGIVLRPEVKKVGQVLTYYISVSMSTFGWEQ